MQDDPPFGYKHWYVPLAPNQGENAKNSEHRKSKEED